MVKTRQRRAAIFEFQEGAEEEILHYVQQNKELLQAHCLAFHADPSPRLQALLQELKISYFRIQNENCFRSLGAEKDSKREIDMGVGIGAGVVSLLSNVVNAAKTISISLEESIGEAGRRVVINRRDSNGLDEDHMDRVADKPDLDSTPRLLPCKIFRRSIRSGEELILHSHNVFLKWINAGAFIRSHGNLEVYGRCEGNLECFGDYIIIRHFAMGRIALQGLNLESKMLDELRSSSEVRMITVEDGQIKIAALANC